MKSIKTKILLVVCLLIVLSLGSVGATVSALMYSSSLSTLRSTMSEAAKIAANLVVEYLNTYKAVAQDTGTIAELSSEDNSVTQKKAIVQAKVKQYNLAGGGIVDVLGKGILDPSLDISDRPYFQQAVKGETVISEIVFGRVSQRYTINVAAPLWDNGVVNSRVVGVVYFNVDANALSDITNEIQVGETGGAYMLDKDNYTIAHQTLKVEDRDNTVEALAQDPSLQPLADIEQKMTQGETGFGLYAYGGKQKLMAYAPVNNGLGWSIAVNAELREFVDTTYTAIFVTIVMILICIAIGLLVSLRLANSIAKPVQEVERAAKALAEGNLDTEIICKSHDEVGRLADSMRTSMASLRTYIHDIDVAMREMSSGNFDLPEMSQPFVGDFTSIETSIRALAEEMSDTLSQIATASDQVSTGAEQVSGGAQALSQGTTEQASSIQQLSATILELSQQVSENAHVAQEARSQTEQAAGAVQASNQQMQEMIAAMSDISQKSGEIGKIIKTIEDIAFQTNILALNAAVEAARAGAAGKGFAVVADEVRNLAGKSAESAKNTTALIEQTVQAVASGTRIAAETAQAGAISQVSIGVDQISSVVQTNSATAEQSAAASEELSGQAQMLKDLVSKFKLKNHRGDV